MQHKDQRLYFDCNATFGPRPKKALEARWSLEHLMEDLDLAGIAGAMVHHQQAIHYDPMLGNLRLIEEISAHRERLFPCWIALPSLCDDVPRVTDFMRLLRQHDVRAVRICSERFNIPVREHLWAELRDALRNENILCVIPTDAFAPLMSLDALLNIFRDNNVLLVGHGWHQWRNVVAWMNQFPNLHLEFSTFQAHYAIEWCARKYGASRCLFGTDLPFKSPGAARGFLDWTFLSDADARLVAGENLRRLLGGAGPTQIPPPSKWDDELTRAARSGLPLPCPVLDAHCHIIHDNANTAGEAMVFQNGDADGMIQIRRRMGINKTAIMSWAAPISVDADVGNAVVENAVRKYPDEFIGVASVNAEYDSPEKIVALIEKYHERLKWPGMKTYTPYQMIDYDDPLYEPWFTYANEKGLYLVLDPKGGLGATQCIRNLAQRYPNMGIHLDHCGQSWEYAKWAAGLMRDHANIWAQLNYTAATNGVIEWLTSQVGADRMLFGTDSPMRDPRPQAGWLAFTRLSESDKRKVFGGNFAAILRRLGHNV